MWATCMNFSDSPYEDRPLLVHVSNENKRFPKVEIVGERDPTHIVAYLARNTTGLLPGADELLTKLAHLDDPIGKTGLNYSDIKYDTDGNPFLFRAQTILCRWVDNNSFS